MGCTDKLLNLCLLKLGIKIDSEKKINASLATNYCLLGNMRFNEIIIETGADILSFPKFLTRAIHLHYHNTLIFGMSEVQRARSSVSWITRIFWKNSRRASSKITRKLVPYEQRANHQFNGQVKKLLCERLQMILLKNKIDTKQTVFDNCDSKILLY